MVWTIVSPKFITNQIFLIVFLVSSNSMPYGCMQINDLRRRDIVVVTSIGLYPFILFLWKLYCNGRQNSWVRTEDVYTSYNKDKKAQLVRITNTIDIG